MAAVGQQNIRPGLIQKAFAQIQKNFTFGDARSAFYLPTRQIKDGYRHPALGILEEGERHGTVFQGFSTKE